MNRQIDQAQRSPVDFTFFAFVFVGIVTSIAAVVVNSAPGAVMGLGLALLGLLYFLLTGD